MILRCTQKFLTELRLKKADTAAQPPATHPLDEWYAHVFTLYPRRKCAVFAHSKTMFCFFALDLKRKDLDNIAVLFRQRLGKALFDEHYPAEVIKFFNDRMREIRIATTTDRMIIGFINRMVQEIQWHARESSDSRDSENEFVLGARYRRGVYMALPHEPVRLMRDILLNCEELKGVSVPESLNREETRRHLGLEFVDI